MINATSSTPQPNGPFGTNGVKAASSSNNPLDSIPVTDPTPSFKKPSANATSFTNTSDVGSPPSSGDGKKRKSTFSPKMVLGALVLMLVLIGSGAGLYLSQQTQDLRQQASTDGEVRETQVATCNGNCGSNGCSPQCGNVFPVSFYCRGNSNSGCNEAFGSSFLGSRASGELQNSQSAQLTKNGSNVTVSTWCSTAQIDSNAGDGSYVVIWIGDTGKKCWTGYSGTSNFSGCESGIANKDALDWDCTNPSPTPTPTPTPTPSSSPVTKTWTVTTQVICPNTAITPSQVPKRLVYRIWPPNPMVWNYKPALNQAGTTGSISQQISVDNITPGLTQNIYVGLTIASDGENWSGKALKPLSPPSGVQSGTYFSNELFIWSAASLPNGTVPLKFEAPPELCVPPSPTPSPSPSPTPSPTPSPSPSPSPSVSPSPSPSATPPCDDHMCTCHATISCTEVYFFMSHPHDGGDAIVYENDVEFARFEFSGDPNGPKSYTWDWENGQAPAAGSRVRVEVWDGRTEQYRTVFQGEMPVCNEPSPSPSPSPIYACNSGCSNDQQCQSVDENYICYQDRSGSFCREKSNPQSNSCTPIGPMCIDIQMTRADNQSGPLQIGNTLSFTCGQVANVDQYEFRVVEPGGEQVNITSSAGSNVSSVYTVAQSGTFVAQCRICPGGICHEWEPLAGERRTRDTDGTRDTSTRDGTTRETTTRDTTTRDTTTRDTTTRDTTTRDTTTRETTNGTRQR